MASIRELLFFVFVISPAVCQRVCPSGPGWIPYNGKCYKFVSRTKLSYNKAARTCQDDGAAIVSVNDANEHKYITDWLEANDGQRDLWWTSGVTSKNGDIRWQGDGTSSNYAGNWLIPSNEYLVNDEKVVYKFADDNYGWAINDEHEKTSFICEIALTEVYRIGLAPRDFDYGLAVNSPVLAPRGPRFLVEPESTVILGKTSLVFFDCVATGNPEPTYEWLKTGRNGMEPLPLSDRFIQVSGRLNIRHPVENDESSYQCKVTNEYGSILSRMASLSFGSLGQFSPVQVGTVYGRKYQGNQLECPVITGKPGISYQWYKNSVLSFIRPEAQKHTFISSTGKLFFSELTESDTGEYFCIANLVSLGNSRNYEGSSQTASRTSVGFKLNVTASASNEYDPDIQKDFIFVYPRVPKRGETVKLECFGYGTGPLTYSWSRKRGTFPQSRSSFRSANRIVIIKQVDFVDEDVYECVVRNPRGRTDSRTVDLKIQAEPHFIYPMSDQHVDIGESLTMHCEALGAPFPTYAWYKDGKMLPRTGNGITINSNTLHITQLDPSQNGMYQCSATNDLGTTFSNGQLRVLSIAPSFEKNPMPKLLYAARGGNITIRCNPIGAPKPTFTWSLEGNNLGLQPGIYNEGDHYRLTLDGDLMIMDVNTNDRGRYLCAVSNRQGDAEDYSVLDIVEGATFSQMPDDKEAEVKMTAVFECQASYPSSMDMIYQWKFNDHIIDFERETEFALGIGNREGYLYVGPVEFRNEGWYTCSIISSMGTQSDSGYLTVEGPPSEPAGVKVREEPLASTDVSDTDKINYNTTRWITWMDGDDNGDNIRFYYVQFRTNYDRKWRVHPDGNRVPAALAKHETYQDTKVLRLTDLKAGAGIEFRVIAQNGFGIGTPSIPTGTAQIVGSKPSQPVRNVRGGGGSVGDLTVVWDPMPIEDHNGPNFKYLVRWRPYDSEATSNSIQWEEGIISHEDACVNEYTFDSGMVYICRHVSTVGALQYYLPYQAQVIGLNTVGRGPPSNISVVMSAEELPLGTPENVYARVFNATALLVTWKPVQNTRESMRGKLQGYKINYWRKNFEDETDALQTPIELPEGEDNLSQGLIIGLEPVTWYSYNVQSYNSAGNGPKSSPYDQQTLNRVPGNFPTEVHVFSIEGEGVRVNFRGVSTQQREEPLQGYKVQVWKDNENIRNAVDYDLGKMSTGIIRNLTSGIIYQLRVFGYSRAGQGERSSPSVYFTVGGGEMRVSLETTEIQSGASYILPSIVVTVLTATLALIGLQTRLLS